MLNKKILQIKKHNIRSINKILFINIFIVIFL